MGERMIVIRRPKAVYVWTEDQLMRAMSTEMLALGLKQGKYYRRFDKEMNRRGNRKRAGRYGKVYDNPDK